MAEIKLAKCSESVVTSTLDTLELNTNGTLKTKVKRLADYYEEHKAEIPLANCDVCGGNSDETLSACPYCGDAGQVVDAAVQGESEEATPLDDEQPAEATADDEQPAEVVDEETVPDSAVE